MQTSFKFREEFAAKLAALDADIKNEKVLFKFKDGNEEGYKFEAVSICRWNADFEIVDKDSYFDLSGVNKDKNAN